MLCSLRHHNDECRLACHLPQDCDGGNDVQHILPGSTTLRTNKCPPHGYGCGSGTVYDAQHSGREFALLDIAGHDSLRGNNCLGKTLYGTQPQPPAIHRLRVRLPDFDGGDDVVITKNEVIHLVFC